MDKKVKIKFNILAIVLVIIFSIALAPITLQNDTYYTIKVGEHIVQNGIDMMDPFSWHENLPYTYPHWAYDVMTYFVYNAGGFLGVYILTAALSAILGVSIYFVNAKLTKNNILSFIITIGAMFLLKDYIAALKEEKELESLLDNILVMNDFINIVRPQKGVAQDGALGRLLFPLQHFPGRQPAGVIGQVDRDPVQAGSGLLQCREGRLQLGVIGVEVGAEHRVGGFPLTEIVVCCVIGCHNINSSLFELSRSRGGRPHGAAPTAIYAPGPLARETQARVLERNRSKFCVLRARRPGGNRTHALLILRAGRAPLVSRGNPRKRGSRG